MSEGGAEWCGEGKRSMWLEGVHGQSLDAFTVQSGWERVCERVVVGGGPGPATIQGHGRLAPTLHCVRFENGIKVSGDYNRVPEQ